MYYCYFITGPSLAPEQPAQCSGTFWEISISKKIFRLLNCTEIFFLRRNFQNPNEGPVNFICPLQQFTILENFNRKILEKLQKPEFVYSIQLRIQEKYES